MLEVVPDVELVDVRPRPPRRLAHERAPGALGEALDEGRLRGRVDDVVEGVVRAHPLTGEARVALPAAQREGQLREPDLGRLELRELLLGDPRRGQLGGEALELRADEERL